jgi:hypothetical protein
MLSVRLVAAWCALRLLHGAWEGMGAVPAVFVIAPVPTPAPAPALSIPFPPHPTAWCMRRRACSFSGWDACNAISDARMCSGEVRLTGQPQPIPTGGLCAPSNCTAAQLTASPSVQALYSRLFLELSVAPGTVVFSCNLQGGDIVDSSSPVSAAVTDACTRWAVSREERGGGGVGGGGWGVGGGGWGRDC